MSDRRPDRNGGSNGTGTIGTDGVESTPSEKEVSPDDATSAPEKTVSASPREILESHLDEKDYEVFRALNENGRMSDTEIADRVGLSRSAVRRRRESLVDEGILEVLAVIVLQEADLAYADVRVSMDENASREARDHLIERLVDADLFYAVHSTLGDHDVLAQGWHASLGELKRYVEDLLTDAKMVDSYDITPAVKTWKDWDKVLDRPTE